MEQRKSMPMDMDTDFEDAARCGSPELCYSDSPVYLPMSAVVIAKLREFITIVNGQELKTLKYVYVPITEDDSWEVLAEVEEEMEMEVSDSSDAGGAGARGIKRPTSTEPEVFAKRSRYHSELYEELEEFCAYMETEEAQGLFGETDGPGELEDIGFGPGIAVQAKEQVGKSSRAEK